MGSGDLIRIGAAIGQPDYKCGAEWRAGFDTDLSAMRLKYEAGDHQA